MKLIIMLMFMITMANADKLLAGELSGVECVNCTILIDTTTLAGDVKNVIHNKEFESSVYVIGVVIKGIVTGIAFIALVVIISFILVLIIFTGFMYLSFINKQKLHDILYNSFKDNHPNEYQDRYIRYALDNNNNCLQITRITEGKYITSDTKILTRECFDDSLETFTGGGYSIKTQVNVDTIFSDLWNNKQALPFTRYLKFWKPISLTELFSSNDLATKFGYKSI